jgi:hypothetical protein
MIPLILCSRHAVRNAARSIVRTRVRMPTPADGYGNSLGRHHIHPFGAPCPRPPHDPCLRFEPDVTARLARLGPDLPATALVERDFHPQVSIS